MKYNNRKPWKAIFLAAMAVMLFGLAYEGLWAPILSGTGSVGHSKAFVVDVERIDPVERNSFQGVETGAMTSGSGKPVFLGGLRLSSSNGRFGGFSGLAIGPDGRSLAAVSDDGWWLSGMLIHDQSGLLTGISDCRLTRMIAPSGKPLKNGSWTDAEGLTPDGRGGFLVSFEQRHRIWRYPAATDSFTARPTGIPLPDWLLSAPHNSGLEAVTRLTDGRLLVIAEDFGKADLTLGAILNQGRWSAFQYRRQGWYKPTDAATLPNGDVLILERSFTPVTGFETRLVKLKRVEIVAGRILTPELVAHIQGLYPTDNFEGLAVAAGPDGRTMVYLISDDNFMIFQQTLILMFELGD